MIDEIVDIIKQEVETGDEAHIDIERDVRNFVLKFVADLEYDNPQTEVLTKDDQNRKEIRYYFPLIGISIRELKLIDECGIDQLTDVYREELKSLIEENIME